MTGNVVHGFTNLIAEKLPFKILQTRLGKQHETCNESLSISEALSGLSLTLHTPTTAPPVCYGAGWTKTMAGECTTGC